MTIIDVLNGLILKVEKLVGNGAFLAASAITLAVFVKKRAFAPTVATGLVAFTVAWIVQPEHLADLANKVGGLLQYAHYLTPPHWWPFPGWLRGVR
jgi:hypothetical protein